MYLRTLNESTIKSQINDTKQSIVNESIERNNMLAKQSQEDNNYLKLSSIEIKQETNITNHNNLLFQIRSPKETNPTPQKPDFTEHEARRHKK